jgi:hypothetical protein
LIVDTGVLHGSAVGSRTLWSAEVRQEKGQGERTPDGMAAGVPVTDCRGIASSAELILEVYTGEVAAGEAIVTPADAQNCRANELVATEIAD